MYNANNKHMTFNCVKMIYILGVSPESDEGCWINHNLYNVNVDLFGGRSFIIFLKAFRGHNCNQSQHLYDVNIHGTYDHKFLRIRKYQLTRQLFFFIRTKTRRFGIF